MENEIEKIWNDVQGHLSKEMKGPSFQTWIKPSKLIELKDGKAIVAVKNTFNRNFLTQHYLEKITTALAPKVGIGSPLLFSVHHTLLTTQSTQGQSAGIQLSLTSPVFANHLEKVVSSVY